MKVKSIKIYLQGGLGNQLFQVAAGRYLAEKLNKRLELVEEFRNLTGTFRKETIMFLEEGIGNSGQISIFRNTIFRVVRKLALSNKIFSWIILKTRGLYFSNEVGYDPVLETINPKGICGYFQTSRYLSHFPETEKLGLTLTPDEEKIIKKIVDEIATKNPVGVHIRRGDYVNETEGIGLLSELYFEEVISSFMEKDRECWIVTDSPDCFEELPSRLKCQTRILKELNDLPAHVSLIVLSKFQELVISNSSFSLAAAFMARDYQTVHFPDPWFRNLPVPTLEIPNTWIAHKSNWVS